MTNSKILRFDPTLGSNNSGLKNYRIKNHHIFGIARTSAFIWHMWIPLKKFCNATRRVCVCIFLVHYGPFPQEVQGAFNCGPSSHPDFIKNYFLLKRMFRFFRHSRQMPYFNVSRQKVTHFNVLGQKVTYFNERKRKEKEDGR